MKNSICSCGSGKQAYWTFDARGIPLAKVCENCEAAKLGKYRKDVLEDPNYWADEPIEPDDDYYDDYDVTPIGG